LTREAERWNLHRELREARKLKGGQLLFKILLRISAGMLLTFAEPHAAYADHPARTWEFDLPAAGSYKLQIEHSIPKEVPGWRVVYDISIGNETRTRKLDLIANRPFIPLVADIPGPRRLRVVVSGIEQAALKRTQVYAYNADSVPYGSYFDPARHGVEHVDRLRDILQRPAEAIDLARAKLTIDSIIDPAVDVEGNVRKLEAIVRRIMTMPEFGTSTTSRLRALRRYVYEAGEWNDHQPFRYDLDDPFGANIRNKLLSNYLVSRKGNCVTMPFLFIILGERLGLDVTVSTAPKHLFVKFRSDVGTWINLEATSGANPARDIWVREQHPMTDEAVGNGAYLRPLTKKETVALMATTLAEHFLQQKEYEKAIAISDLILEYNPKDIETMVRKAVAYGRLGRDRFVTKYPSPRQIPVRERAYYAYLSRNHHQWFAKAEALGWREETKDEEEKYLLQVNKARKQKLETREVPNGH
jgi:regulator of sirC expression with transglutaminase-like and TPR domain